MSKRPITALAVQGLAPAVPPTPKPEITWISPSELLVDEAYQRDLSEASHKLIRRIVEGWDSRRFKPPIVAWTEAGLEVIDGQHTAIAAETHPDIATIPVLIVDAAVQADRASAFIGHAKDRLGITAAQIHHAAVTAGDADALTVARVCAAAEVTLLRLPPAGAIYKPRTTIAVAAVRAIVASETEGDAVFILRTLADAGLAPITASQIRAVQNLITAPEFVGLDREALATVIAATPIKAAEQSAREHAAVHCVPAWRGLAAVWFKGMTGKRPRKAEPVVEAPAATATAPPTAAGNPVSDPAADPRRARHADIVEAARRAVPAPTFSRPGGASVRTG